MRDIQNMLHLADLLTIKTILNNLQDTFGLRGGGVITRPEDYALDFAFTAVLPLWLLACGRAKKTSSPGLSPEGLPCWRIIICQVSWYIVIGGLGGAITAMPGPVEPSDAREGDHVPSH